jgi:hypothetical protein
VHVEFLDADDPGRETDLTLQLSLTRAADGAVRAEVDDLTVMYGRRRSRMYGRRRSS